MQMVPTALIWCLLFATNLFAAETEGAGGFDIREIERSRILRKADEYMSASPRTVTADKCARSQGGLHDFYSEGDYWWPDPADPGGPYVRRDGQTNPDNFIAHRKSIIRLSDIIATLVSSYLITKDEKHAAHAVVHLKAWFVDEGTRMNSSLLYGQAIKGRHTGRSIGIIDTIHLVEVARGAKRLAASPSFTVEDQKSVKAWFREYLSWINTHPYGEKEKHHPNNHGVCWSLQAAAFADLVGDQEQLGWIREQFKKVYLKEMMDERGGFPAELERTKPYGYSLFVIDAMAGVAQIASTEDDDLWTFELPDGRGLKKGMEFIVPYIADKGSWPKEPDVMYWDDWPVRHPSLLLAGLHFDKQEYLKIWEKLEGDPKTYEVLRNFPMRHPLLWTAGVEQE
ncbi:alginate lyase family protein [Haloferula sp.]|uniref:alginate lyase family protein n=1 Tax=Haloferula sp. TaxID=2497595 RepID=UPI00329C82CF